MQEVWEVCDEFPDFAVSDYGRVINTINQRQVPIRVNQQGLSMVTVKDPMGHQFTRCVSLLVARCFVEVPNPWFTSVIHLNGERTDCRATNLMWRSRPFSLQYHRMFEELPLRVAAAIRETGEAFNSLRELCTTYGLIERLVYNYLDKEDNCFPYNWHIVRVSR